MRESGNEAHFLSDRKKVNTRVNGKDEGADARRRLSGGGHGVSYGLSKAALAGNHISSVSLTGVRLKGGSTMQSRHHSHAFLIENTLTKEVAIAGEEALSKKRPADEEGILPQWGHGKRSRCSRFETAKHARESGPKSSVRSEKTPHLPQRLRGPKITPSKTLSNGLLQRTANGVTHSSNSVPASTRNGGEAKERVMQKDRAPPFPKNASVEARCPQGNELATGTQGLVHGNGHLTRGSNLNEASVINGPCKAHMDKIHDNNVNNAACILSSEPSSHAKQPRADVQTLEWPRIMIALTRKEKEDDFLVLKGTKLPQRPKKRPKAVEKALHYCTPGSWLSDLSRGRYDVREKKSCKKKPRGLKAMESLDSDSE